MKKVAFSIPWMSDCPLHAKTGTILDECFCDFDAQAERLTGHDQDYVQLSSGPFLGRFISCFLGPRVSLHAEHANQMLQQTVLGAPDSYSIGVVLDKDVQFRIHGRDVGWDELFVLPPNGTLYLRSPAEASILAVVIEKALLFEKLSAAPQIIDWLNDIEDRPTLCRAPVVAQRLRQDAHNALKSSSISIEGAFANVALGEMLVSSFTASLMLEWTQGLKFEGAAIPKSFERFLAIHTRATSNDACSEIETISAHLELSQRSIQYACAKEGMMGFGAYNRLLRLHAVRRSLQAGKHRQSSIGDIASEFGFLNWSHFGEQYRNAFGERPSETRGSSRTDR